MKKVNVVMFECEYCHSKFENPNDAENCEARHVWENEIQEIENSTKFTIEDKHIKLLKGMNVEWDDCEFGAPCIDPKRPYGNSDVFGDIAEIIGLKKKGNYDYKTGEWKDNVCDELYKLHREMMIVLQIILSTGQIKKGTYVKVEKYGYESWKLKEGNKK